MGGRWVVTASRELCSFFQVLFRPVRVPCLSLFLVRKFVIGLLTTFSSRCLYTKEDLMPVWLGELSGATTSTTFNLFSLPPKSSDIKAVVDQMKPWFNHLFSPRDNLIDPRRPQPLCQPPCYHSFPCFSLPHLSRSVSFVQRILCYENL